MATVDDVRQALLDLADRADDKASDPRVAYRNAVSEARRGSSRSVWLRVAAATVLVAAMGAGLFSWLASGDDGADVITEADEPELPEKVPEVTEPPGPTTTIEPAPSRTEDSTWRQVEGVTFETVPHPLFTGGIATDGEAFYALSEGELVRSTGDEWVSMTSMLFPSGSTTPSEPTAWPAAAHDGTVVVLEGDRFSPIVVHVVSADGSVSSAEIPRTEEQLPAAAIGPQGMLVVEGSNVHRSVDGQPWELVSTSVENGSSSQVRGPRVVATDGGFVLASPAESDGLGGYALSFSPDGRVWDDRIVTDAEGNARYTEFTGVSSFRGGAAAWTEAGVWLLDANGAEIRFIDDPQWVVSDTEPCCSARRFGLFGGGAGLAFVNGFVDQGGSLVPPASIAVGDGVGWTTVPLPDADLDYLTTAIATTRESILVIDGSRAWTAGAIGLSADELPEVALPGPAVVTAEAIARAYMAARDRGDDSAVLELFADDAVIVDGADLDDRQTVAEHSQALAFYAATDWRWTAETCAGREGLASVTVVCRYRHSNAWSRAIGSTLEPAYPEGVMGEGEIELEIVDGQITRLDHRLAVFVDALPIDVSRAWSDFADFVGAAHPDDVATMYDTPSSPNLTPASVALWGAYTDEFVSGS